MKTVFFLLACTCLIDGLTSSFIGFSLEDKNIKVDASENRDHNEVISENNPEELILPIPLSYPNRRPVLSTTKSPTSKPTSPVTTTPVPTTAEPETPTLTTIEPTTSTTSAPTTSTTSVPTTSTTSAPTTSTTSAPTTSTTSVPTTTEPPTPTPTTIEPTTPVPSTTEPTTPVPTTAEPTIPNWSSTTTTRRPTCPPGPPPSTTTPKPIPRPDLKNPQIYNNAARSLGPFAGKLINVVFNKKGNQNTNQENEISYNLRFLKPNRGLSEGEN